MGFWDTLKKVGKVAAPVAAGFIPGVGPLAAAGIGAVLNSGVAGNVGRVAGDTAGTLRDERFTEDEARRHRDQLALSRANLGVGQNTSRDANALDRAKFGIDAPMARTRQAAYGDALQNVQDVNIDFRPQTGAATKFNVTGGLRPSMFGPNARAAGGELSRQALLALMSKSDLPEASTAVDLPELSTPQGSSGLEKVTGGIGLGGSFLDALSPLLQSIRKKPGAQPTATMQTPPIMPTNTDPNVWRRVKF